ncbi:MAG: hypothetical protein JXR19_06395 [Bacteroidia bacterium]
MMLLIWLFSIWAALNPTHDFHTSVMNFTYKDDEKHFQIDLNLDTEQFEYFLNQQSKNDVSLDVDIDDELEELIEDAINEHIKLRLNGSVKPLKLSVVEVTYAETILQFEPICYRRKLKSFEMSNSLLFTNFPKQKNLVKVNYRGEVRSLLFQIEHQKDVLEY